MVALQCLLGVFKSFWYTELCLVYIAPAVWTKQDWRLAPPSYLFFAPPW